MVLTHHEKIHPTDQFTQDAHWLYILLTLASCLLLLLASLLRLACGVVIRHRSEDIVGVHVFVCYSIRTCIYIHVCGFT